MRPAPGGCNCEARTGARLVCLSLALKMIAGVACGDTLNRAVIAAAEALEPGTALPQLVRSIARDWPRLRGDAAALAEAGARLERAVLDDCRPQPRFRRDLDG